MRKGFYFLKRNYRFLAVDSLRKSCRIGNRAISSWSRSAPSDKSGGTLTFASGFPTLVKC